MTKLIVVLGVTGTQVLQYHKASSLQSTTLTNLQGGSVAAKFTQDPNWTVRGVTRNISSPAARELAAKGVELVQADLDDAKSFEGVFSGANAIFAVTDFWAPFFAAYGRLKETSDRATGQYALDIEVKRGKVIVDAAAKALQDEGKLETFVWSSLPPEKELSGGKYSYVYHFDGKAKIREYIRSEQPELNERTSVLYMGFYSNNAIKYAGLKSVVKESDGSYTWFVTGSKDALHPFVEPHDAGVLTSLLVGSTPGKTLLGHGDMMSYEAFTTLIAQHVGVRIVCKDSTVADSDKAVPGGLGREVAESTASCAEFGWGKDLVMPKDLDPNAGVTSMKEYVQKENWEVLFPEFKKAN